jgi:hypothetical protein
LPAETRWHPGPARGVTGGSDRPDAERSEAEEGPSETAAWKEREPTPRKEPRPPDEAWPPDESGTADEPAAEARTPGKAAAETRAAESAEAANMRCGKATSAATKSRLGRGCEHRGPD